MNITTFEHQYTPEMIVERVTQDNSTSGIWSILMKAFGDNKRDKPYESIYQVYVPLFITYVDIELNRNIKNNISDNFIIGINSITGAVGEIDQLPTQQESDVDSRSVLTPILNEMEAHSKAEEWIFKYVDRTYRTLQMPQYEVDVYSRHLLYWLVDLGSFEYSYAINDLTGRRDSVDSLVGVSEYYNNNISDAE